MPEPVIKVENLNVIFDVGTQKETHVLKDVSFEINAGEYVILFGPSGCGKSTLLYHLAGLDNQSKGESKIFVDDIDILKISGEEMLQVRKRKMGMIFQAYNLINTIKVIYNVCLPLFFHGKNNKETIQKGERKLEALGVLAQKDKLPSSLSGGQQQRVAIARALITDPDIILADEPVGNLDFKSSYDVLTILSDLNIKQKKTIVFVTHDMNYLQFADKVIYLWDGTVSKVEINKHKITPRAKFGDVEKEAMSGFVLKLVRSLVDFILMGEEKEVLGKRVEHVLSTFLRKEMSWESLIDFFSAPIRSGGLGLSPSRVKKIEIVLKKMRIENNILFFKYFHKIDKNDIVDILCHEVDCSLDDFQKGRLADIIEFRMTGIVDDDNIEKFLTAPKEEKGLNLPAHYAEEIGEKISIFMDLMKTAKEAKKELPEEEKEKETKTEIETNKKEPKEPKK